LNDLRVYIQKIKEDKRNRGNIKASVRNK